MTAVGGAVRRPVGLQLVRGIGYFAAGVVALFTALLLAGSVKGRDNDFAASPSGRVAGTAVILGLLVGGYLTYRSLRRWSGRPRWLLPVGSLVVVAALVPALWAPTPAGSVADGCLPLISAWEQVVATPDAADLAYFEASFVTPTRAEMRDKARRAALVAATDARHANPAYRRVNHYEFWASSDAACAPVSRTHLAWSAAALGIGAAGVAAAVRRRRRA